MMFINCCHQVKYQQLILSSVKGSRLFICINNSPYKSKIFLSMSLADGISTWDEVIRKKHTVNFCISKENTGKIHIFFNHCWNKVVLSDIISHFGVVKIAFPSKSNRIESDRTVISIWHIFINFILSKYQTCNYICTCLSTDCLQ